MDKRNGVSRNAQPFETPEEDGEKSDDGKPAPDEKFVDMENAKDYAENEYAGTKNDGEDFAEIRDVAHEHYHGERGENYGKSFMKKRRM